MTGPDLLARLVRWLEEAEIAYMLAGSFASAYHGQPRTTHDIDIVIDPTAEALERFLAAVTKGGLYVSPERARSALAERAAFNVIDASSGWKADLIVRRSRPFSAEEFARRQRTRVIGLDIVMATAEDTILSKLEWAARGGSERQLEDVKGIVAVQGDRLDRAYIRRWAATLGVADVWSRVGGDPPAPG